MTLPTVNFDNVGVFTVAIIVLYLTVIAIHELGHAIAGRLVGYDVLLCGVGFRQPFIPIRLGGCLYYLGWPPVGGFTFALTKTHFARQREFAIYVAGGPLADLSVACISFFAWHKWGGNWLALLFYLAAFQSLVNLIPLSWRVGQLSFGSDALQLLRLWRGHEVAHSHSGAGAASWLSFAYTCRNSRQTRGVPTCLANAALCQLVFEDPESVRQSLSAPEFDHPDRSAASRTTEAVAHAYLALAESSEDIEERVAVAQARLAESSHRTAWLSQLLGLEVNPRREALEEVHDLAVQAGYYGIAEGALADWIIEGRIAASEDEASRLLETRGRRAIAPVAPAAAVMAGPFARRARRDMTGARQAFDLAVAEFQKYLAAFPPGVTRDRFVAQMQSSVNELANQLGAPIPELSPRIETTPAQRDR